MARKLWHDSFAADFGRKDCFFISNHAQYPVLSMSGITDQNSFSGERNNGLSCCCGMICPLHSTQRAYRITWLSSVAFYHSEPQQNPLSTFFNTIYDRMGSRSKERPRGITGRLVLMESLPYCGCMSQVCFPDTDSTEILLKLRSKSFTNIWAIFAQMQQVCCNPHIKVAELLRYLQISHRERVVLRIGGTGGNI